ncbi:chromosome partitioning protein ParB [Bacterioplanes sanyensis]|uniref:Probable chromosome-partitioning protein ParB n=1 Tax=Bacterioplanes sanyensis TaxID=1249553 RepID=A0A222FGL7_9GAMM|nr:ParB/RepB/Spo0J family partition protein [Bacterioplanes sanyensis]ASP37889.1 chromosome partitioning protein ParB [Bacterioplanes sanyensis]
MVKKKRGLGRGLDALMAGSKAATEADISAEQVAAAPQIEEDEALTDGTLRRLPVEWIQPGQYQPRRDMHPEALEELAASIKAQGLMQPVVVRPLPGATQRFELIAGERRWRACQLAGLDTLPALIRLVSDETTIAMALIENIQREDLNPMEEANALKRLQQEFDLTQLEVAEAVGKNRATVANLLRLTNLNDDVKRLLEHGDIDMGHARALLALEGGQQSEAAAQVVAKALNVRQTEALVRQLQQTPTESTAKNSPDPDIKRLEQVLGDRLGAQVAIQHGNKGKGKLVINYTSLDELEGILSHIQ